MTLKVLFPMKPPLGYENYRIVPLVALWSAVSNSNLLKPYFSVHNRYFNEGLFPHFDVFSSSLDLRTLDMEFLDIDLPRFSDRLTRIKEIVQF